MWEEVEICCTGPLGLLARKVITPHHKSLKQAETMLLSVHVSEWEIIGVFLSLEYFNILQIVPVTDRVNEEVTLCNKAVKYSKEKRKQAHLKQLFINKRGVSWCRASTERKHTWPLVTNTMCTAITAQHLLNTTWYQLCDLLESALELFWVLALRDTRGLEGDFVWAGVWVCFYILLWTALVVWIGSEFRPRRKTMLTVIRWFYVILKRQDHPHGTLE